MAITHIRRLREWGIFHDFTWPADLPEFKKYNLIYGWNWFSKTTLSRIFAFWRPESRHQMVRSN